jgi:protein TonB
MKTDYENATMLDMIFENRNKSYGAYALRNTHSNRMAQAILIMISSIFLLGFGKFVSDKLKGSSNQLSGPIVVLHVLPEIHLEDKDIKVEPPKPTPPKAQAINTIRNTELNVVANNQLVDSMPTNDQLHDAEAGLATNINPNTIGATDGHGTEATFEVAAPAVELNKIYDRTEVMPEFPGGEQALMSFLQRKTVYPDRERDLEIEGKAYVKFVVNEDGTISNVSVAKTESSGFGKEAVRVVGLMPKFKPGTQQGKAVRVQYVLPFHFKLNH